MFNSNVICLPDCADDGCIACRSPGLPGLTRRGRTFKCILARGDGINPVLSIECMGPFSTRWLLLHESPRCTLRGKPCDNSMSGAQERICRPCGGWP